MICRRFLPKVSSSAVQVFLGSLHPNEPSSHTVMILFHLGDTPMPKPTVPPPPPKDAKMDALFELAPLKITRNPSKVVIHWKFELVTREWNDFLLSQVDRLTIATLTVNFNFFPERSTRHGSRATSHTMQPASRRPNRLATSILEPASQLHIGHSQHQRHSTGTSKARSKADTSPGQIASRCSRRQVLSRRLSTHIRHSQLHLLVHVLRIHLKSLALAKGRWTDVGLREF